MSAYAKLDSMKNLEVRVKSDGHRRKTVSRNDGVGDSINKADKPSEIAKMAASMGMADEEIMKRAKQAPNFGQFRMVMGNRMRGIQRRIKAGVPKSEAGVMKRKPSAAGRKTAIKVKPKAKAKGK